LLYFGVVGALRDLEEVALSDFENATAVKTVISDLAFDEELVLTTLVEQVHDGLLALEVPVGDLELEHLVQTVLLNQRE